IQRSVGLIMLGSPITYARPVPECLGHTERVDAGGLPPSLFVADAVNLAVMHAAERDRKLITRLAPERARLRIAQAMRVARPAAADQAGLPGDIAQMVFVAVAARLGNGQRCLT